jgi:hypothetical protein
MTPGAAKSRQELFWLPYPEPDRVIINAHNFNPPPLVGVFTAGPPAPTRRDFSGSVGYRFRPVNGFTLKAMGRFVGSIFSQSHQIGIYSEAGTLLRSVTVTTSSEADANGWRYEMLSSELVLAAATDYRVSVTENNNGDNWQDSRSVTGYADAAVIGSTRSAFGLSQNAFPNTIADVLGTAYAFIQLYY